MAVKAEPTALFKKWEGERSCREYVKKNWDNDPPGEEYIYSLLRVSKQQIIFGVNYIPRFNFSGGRIVWDKLNDGSDQSGAEIAYCSLNERVDIVRYMWRGMMQGEQVGSFWQQGDKRINEVRIHPTQKPVALYRWLLENYATLASAFWTLIWGLVVR